MVSVTKLLGTAARPFRGLTPAQKRLLLLRIGSSLVAVCIAVILYVLRSYPSSLYVARINCSQLDVAAGLYQSLRSLMTETIISKGSGSNVLPIDLVLTDSEVSILTQYAQTQVLNAPQAIVLGAQDWCTVNYATDFAGRRRDYSNMSTTCYEYGSLNFYDYRTLLLQNQLEIILAYAYESEDVQSAAYKERIQERSARYDVMRIMYAVQLALQVVLLAAGVFIYGTRGGAPDLAHTSAVTLNAVALVALTAGCTMVVSTAIVLADLAAMRAEIRRGLGDFGILMSVGPVFLALAAAALAVASLGMLAWIVPLWCANPADHVYDLDEQIHPAGFTAKPYQLQRQPQAARAPSRLFADAADRAGLLDNPFDEKLGATTGTTSITDTTSTLGTSSTLGTTGPVPLGSNSAVHSEWELRQLSEKLSRKLSVRHVHGPGRRRGVPGHLLPEKDTRDLLYGPTPLSNHQYPQAFARPVDASAISRAASLTYDARPAGSVRTRHLLEGQEGPPSRRGTGGKADPFLGDGSSVLADGSSVLDDAEVRYLDNNKFMNQWAG